MTNGPQIPVPQPVQTDPAKLRWGIVSTVKAPLRKIAEFIAFHLDLGAQRIRIHLDVPDPSIAERLAHPRVRFTQCDDRYWQGKPSRARATHQRRQMFNAARTYRVSQLDWLIHIDVDEFILSPHPLAELLAAVEPDASHIELQPVEMMEGSLDPHHFKRPASKTIRRTIYPVFGEHIPGGFIGTRSPKIAARTGLPNVRLGIHALHHAGQPVPGAALLPGVELGHAHAPDFKTFERHLAYRLSKGSYHDRNGETNLRGHLFRALMDDPEPDALRAFHTELCVPTSERIALLKEHGLLRVEALNLDAKVERFFGNLED
ncbi:glycosyltransferase family 2 protein [uncultured Tateyamaria sp.]|uniref:glycosyltransferase family 2 protein n=1 Tax=uncultured Tateyamaria sp. TaxID=455651 RepID=UPI002605524B|nr:glycosyltransferase family 2 protein [uncultured Tateyamaria sp.]